MLTLTERWLLGVPCRGQPHVDVSGWSFLFPKHNCWLQLIHVRFQPLEDCYLAITHFMFEQLTSLPKCSILLLFSLNHILKQIIQTCVHRESSPNSSVSSKTQDFSADMASTLPAGLGPDVVYWQLFFQLCRGFLGQLAACWFCNLDLSDCFSFNISKTKAQRKIPVWSLSIHCVLCLVSAVQYPSASTVVAYIPQKKCMCKYPQIIM